MARFEKVSGRKSKDLFEVAKRGIRDAGALGRYVEISLLIAT